MQFIKTIQNFAFQKNLWQKGSRILVGVSGGPDSCCLLDILAKLAPKYVFEIQIVHVNYGLRSKDSKLDEEFVRSLAEKYNFQIHVLKPKKSQYKGNLENCLRNIRYEFFESIRKEQKFDLVAVAHNQDDQAETVLMRMFRGSGLNGLSAMKAKRGNIIRPLLATSKKDILAYLKENKLKFRIDKTNNKKVFTRNKIRHELIPYLEKRINSNIRQTLASWSEIVACDYEFIELSTEKLNKVFFGQGGARFKAQDFLNFHESLQRQILRMIVLKLSHKEPEIGKIEELRKFICGDKNKISIASIGGLKINKKGDSIEIFC